MRVIAGAFRPSRSQRRVSALNRDVIGEMQEAKPTTEQYSVFRAYLDSRHRDGGMADMSMLDYATMVDDSHVQTRLVEYRLKTPDSGKRAGRLLAVALTDVLSGGLSMVYAFYNPEDEELVVRGSHIGPYERSVIAHELVHALDDQHFDLDRKFEDSKDESSLGFSELRGSWNTIWAVRCCARVRRPRTTWPSSKTSPVVG